MNTEPGTRRHEPSSKRCEKFHELFKSIPKNEVLEYSSTCLLHESSKMYQGRMYISNEHVCFFSKSFFGKASIIIRFKNVIAIELTTKILLQQCLNVITYDKTYSFRGVSFKDSAYAIALRRWQKVLGLHYRVTSIFQVDIPQPAEIIEERAMSEEERVFPLSVREMIREITNTQKALSFYKTLTDENITINTYVNRRTIQFANEYIDEIYIIHWNILLIEYHSKGTLCRIYITPKSSCQTTVRIIEKYNYTTQHYFMYLAGLCDKQAPLTTSTKLFACVHLVSFLLFFIKRIANITNFWISSS